MFICVVVIDYGGLDGGCGLVDCGACWFLFVVVGDLWMRYVWCRLVLGGCCWLLGWFAC